jgi:hypothetical protein
MKIFKSVLTTLLIIAVYAGTILLFAFIQLPSVEENEELQLRKYKLELEIKLLKKECQEQIGPLPTK